MSFFRTSLAVAGWGSLATTLSYVLATRKSKIHPLDTSDYLMGTSLFARFNPYDNPVTRDVCIRRVPLSKIKPELLEQEGALVQSFCQGVWSGWGYAYQRRYLEKKYRGPDTATQLWDREELESSSYDVGTVVTDHFEVLAKSENSIIVRCGDSPRIQTVRESDGLFEMVAEVKKEEGVAEFQLKSVFYNGIAQPDKEGGKLDEPMGPWTQWAHAQYSKIFMETAIRRCMR
ncbi:uncharacterized protein LTR77_001153 [Saxophila tyrrhenica]|uniref:Uncharacterized protein n=1 Tax=Saxophila tyrrhenica TaxID=1690608 RepID=A0AAV9PJP9_9PEZI|nr:hypothetical protein LTR77_001153 [Saxophila tyrrhenica]